eukprot:3927431-Lingulodinium_polyedra.AAC.1
MGIARVGLGGGPGHRAVGVAEAGRVGAAGEAGDARRLFQQPGGGGSRRQPADGASVASGGGGVSDLG